MLMLSSETTNPVHYHNQFYMNELLANIDDALIASDANLAITSWNKAAERIYGIKAEQAIGAHRNRLLKYEYMDSSFHEIVDDLKTTGKWKGVLKYTRKDGVEVYLQSSATVVKNDVDDVVGYVAVNRDITQQFLAQQSLQHFTAIMHGLNESFLLVDKNMKVAFLSPKKNVKEFHKSDYKIGDHALRFIPEKDIEEVTANYKKAFRGETIMHEAESHGEAESRIYLHITYLPIRNNYDFVTHVAVIIKDLTDEKRLELTLKKKKQAEKQFQQSRVLFENFMENCPLPAWVTDEEGTMQYMNPTYVTEFQAGKEASAQSIFQLFPKELANEYYQHNKEVLTCNKAITKTVQSIKTNGKNNTFLTTKFPLYYLGKKMVGGWAIDVTEQSETQGELKTINEFKTKLLAIISHDLRSPLTTISALTSLVGGDNELFTREDLIEFLTIIRASNQRVLSLLDDLRIWGQSAMNKISYRPKETELSSLIPSTINFLQENLVEKHIRVSYQLQPDLTAYADVDMLKTVLRNLVSNAVKFSPVQSQIIIMAKSVEDTITISVSDEGTGIDEDLKNHILKGRNNISTYGTKGEKGIGLGLVICKDFIEANKGALQIQNNETKGCTLSFTVPLFKADL